MLVLSRKQGEAITVESDIEIEVLDIRKGRVRLGIRAPRSRKIIRAEISEQSSEKVIANQRREDADHEPAPRRRSGSLGASNINPCR